MKGLDSLLSQKAKSCICCTTVSTAMQAQVGMHTSEDAFPLKTVCSNTLNGTLEISVIKMQLQGG